MKKIIILICIILISCLCSSNSYAFWGISKKFGKTAIKGVVNLGKAEGALPEKKIIELTEMIQKAGDIKKVGKALGDMKLSDEILEDTYMRIILRQRKVTRKEAEGGGL